MQAGLVLFLYCVSDVRTATAPLSKAWSMNLLPSKFGPLMAINRASLLIDRVSVEIFEKLIFFAVEQSENIFQGQLFRI